MTQLNASPTHTAQGMQCLTFALGGQRYALPILTVQEIRRYTPPTSLPSVPSHVLGVINLRGTVVPVFDLRRRFGCAAAPIDRLTVTIVVSVFGRHVGLVVDDVNKVISVHEGMLQPSPQLASHIVVRQFLAKEQIPQVCERMGGNAPREVYLRTDTGEAFVRNVEAVQAAQLSKAELAAYARKPE